MRVDQLLPEVYYKESRDFAYIGRLLEIVFNYMKTAADCVHLNLDHEGIDGAVTDLLVDSLGFELKHDYVNKDLIGIATTFSNLLKYKGSTTAIEMAVRLLLNSQDIKNASDFDFCILDSEKAEIQINIPDVLVDIVLLEDLFDYILPAGITYKFTKISNINNLKQSTIIPKSILESDTAKTKEDMAEATSVYAFDSNIGVVKSEDSDSDKSGSFYIGVVATDIRDPEELAEEAISNLGLEQSSNADEGD